LTLIKYLLDTNICIYIIKKRPIEVLEKFRTLPIGSVGISIITFAELQFGAEKSSNPVKNKEALTEFLIPIEIIDFSYDAALTYGKIRANLEKQGTPIGAMDLLIAAHALSLNTILITNNTNEFKRITELKLENWVRTI
jgi:tRNA(fMet)-specific endonuclease VapC